MKKNVKRLLTVAFTLAMIFSSIYVGTKNMQEVRATSDVSTDMLQVKFQVAQDREDAIRVISTVDSLDYSSAGFEILVPDSSELSGYRTITHQTQTVYERIVSKVTGEEYEFSPKLIDGSSEYFVTGIYAATEGVEYSVRAFVTTLDAPTVKVYGPSRSVCLGDKASDTINMMTDFVTTENATYDVYSGDAQVGTAKVIADKNVRISLLSRYSATSFKSATIFTFKNGETSVGTTVYRNYYTKYTGSGTEDTSWYDVNKTATEFVIASSADLYGLAKVVNNNTDLFAGDTVIQVRNIEINKGTASASAWTPSTGENAYEWDKIGTATYPFKGIYDGDDNTICGLMDVAGDSVSSGLFGVLEYGGLISNLKVANSKFSFNYKDSAAIVGLCRGSLKNIYVDKDVYIKNTVDVVGGLIGVYLNASNQSNTVENCWFAGTVEGTAYVGGLIGFAFRGNLTLEDCLFTGNVASTGRVGGFVAQVTGESAIKMQLVIKDSISAGTISTKEAYAAGSVVGMNASNAMITIENVYSNENRTYTGTGAGFTTSGTATGIGYFGANTAPIYGIPMVLTEDLYGASAYTNTEFDFWSADNEEGVWLAVNDSTPVLRVGADVNSAIQSFTGKRSTMSWYYNAYTHATQTAMSLPATATFKLDSAADLNGLAANKISYKGYTVQLTADIDLNPGWEPQIDKNGNLLNATNVNTWESIGTTEAATAFKGTFDGQGHSVSGMYQVATVSMSGMFARLEVGSVVKNLKIINSYFSSTAPSSTVLSTWDVGSVAGCAQGDLSNIYSNAIVVSNTWDAGGMIGRLRCTASGEVRKIESCWFDGQLLVTGNNELCKSNAAYGGIVGRLATGAPNNVCTYEFTNCLNTGTVKRTAANTSSYVGYVAGIVGGEFGTYSPKIKMTDCLNVGVVSDPGNFKGGLIGIMRAQVTMTDCYSTTESCTKATGQFYDGATINGSSTYNDADYQVTRESILLDNAKTVAAGLFNEESTAWICDTVSSENRGTPILNYFADWWKTTICE